MARQAKPTGPRKGKKATKRKSRKTRKPSATGTRARIIAAMLDQAAAVGWRAVTLKTIAENAGLRLSAVTALFPTRQAVLAGFLNDVDDAVRAGTDPADAAGSPPDRLFDVLMRRFDILRPHKTALVNIARDLPGDPLTCLCTVPRFRKSMAAMLEAAHLSPAGCAGMLKIKGLGLVYLNAARIWLRDDTPDMSKTMAALDKGLRRADSLAAAIFQRRAA